MALEQYRPTSGRTIRNRFKLPANCETQQEPTRKPDIRPLPLIKARSKTQRLDDSKKPLIEPIFDDPAFQQELGILRNSYGKKKSPDQGEPVKKRLGEAMFRRIAYQYRNDNKDDNEFIVNPDTTFRLYTTPYMREYYQQRGIEPVVPTYLVLQTLDDDGGNAAVTRIKGAGIASTARLSCDWWHMLPDPISRAQRTQLMALDTGRIITDLYSDDRHSEEHQMEIEDFLLSLNPDFPQLLNFDPDEFVPEIIFPRDVSKSFQLLTGKTQHTPVGIRNVSEVTNALLGDIQYTASPNQQPLHPGEIITLRSPQ